MPNTFLGFPVPWAKIASAIEGGILHEREGATDFDWTHATLIADGADHDLDCSAIVPGNASWVLFDVAINGPTPGSGIGIDKDGTYDWGNNDSLYVQVNGIDVSKSMLIPCPADRVLTYWLDNIAWTGIGILIRGWFM